jgi:outer membrane protein
MNKIVLAVCVVAVSMFAGIGYYVYASQVDIGFVRTHDLIEKFQGTIEARAKFEEKKQVLQANVDSLGTTLRRAQTEYIANVSKLSIAQKKFKEDELAKQQNHFLRYRELIEQEINNEDNKMMGTVLDQVNVFVKKYAIANGYEIVMGTTLSGSLLYGKESMDITDKVLVELNKEYKGE